MGCKMAMSFFQRVPHSSEDLFSTPFATDLIRNMADEASDIALEEEADFITGHR